MLYKHYIEKDKDGNIIKSFTNGFEQPTKDSILVRESSERHFNLDLYIFENGKAKHKYIYDKHLWYFSWSFSGGVVFSPAANRMCLRHMRLRLIRRRQQGSRRKDQHVLINEGLL